MKQMRLKNLCVGQSFSMCRVVTRFTKVYKVVAINDKAYLCFEYGTQRLRTFKKDIIVFIQFVNDVEVAYVATDEFCDYLNSHNHLVLVVNYGVSRLTDEVIYI